MRFKNIRSGFSLIEVNMAILIAAGGLLSLFALFPVSLRQSVMSSADLHQVTFSSSFFEAISSNIRLIDDVEKWNNPTEFWKAAVEGTGIEKTLLTPSKMKETASDATGELIEGGLNAPAEELRFVLRETDDVDENFSGGKIKLPPQMVVRVRPIKQFADSGMRVSLPSRYAVSVLSTHEFAPAIFHHNTVYSQEFYFQRRP